MREGEGGRGRIRNAKCNFLPRSTEQGMDAAADANGRTDALSAARISLNIPSHPSLLSPAFPFCLLPSNMFDLTKTTPSRHERSRGSLSPVSPRSLDVFGHDS